MRTRLSFVPVQNKADFCARGGFFLAQSDFFWTNFWTNFFPHWDRISPTGIGNLGEIPHVSGLLKPIVSKPRAKISKILFHIRLIKFSIVDISQTVGPSSIQSLICDHDEFRV